MKFNQLTAEVERQEREIKSHNKNKDLKHENQDLKHENQDLQNELGNETNLCQSVQQQIKDLQRKIDTLLGPGGIH